MLRTIGRRGLAVTASSVVGVVLSLAVGTASPAAAASHHHAPPPPAPVPAPAPAPSSPTIGTPVTLPAAASTTYLGSNFSAGGYAITTYPVVVTRAGTYAAQYATDGGVAVNTYVDGVFSSQIEMGAGVPNPGRSSRFPLSAGRHTIGTSSPDGYGNVTISLVGPS